MDSNMLRTLVAQVGTWSQTNFGNQSHNNPLMGAIEEIILELDDDPIDALCDAIIFLCDYGSKRKLVPELLAIECAVEGRLAQRRELRGRLLKALGQLVQSNLKIEQNIRPEKQALLVPAYNETVSLLFKLLELYNKPMTHVLEVWSEVEQRDWNKARLAQATVEADEVELGIVSGAFSVGTPVLQEIVRQDEPVDTEPVDTEPVDLDSEEQ